MGIWLILPDISISVALSAGMLGVLLALPLIR